MGTILSWFGARIWVYEQQMQDMRLRIAYERSSALRDYSVYLYVEKRDKWLWKNYAKIRYTDSEKIMALLQSGNRYLRK